MESSMLELSYEEGSSEDLEDENGTEADVSEGNYISNTVT